MTTCCQGDDLDDGQASGGGGASSSALLFSQVPTVTVADVALNTIVSTSVPASYLANNGDHLIADFWGDVLSGNAGSTWFVGISLNAVVLWGDVSAAFGASATRRPWRMFVDIERKSPTTLAFGGFVLFGNSALLPINGQGDITTAPQGNSIGSVPADPVVAWGSAQLFELAVQANIAGGNQLVLRGGSLERKLAP